MAHTFNLITPIDGSVYAERTLHTLSEATSAVQRSRDAQRDWSARSISERATYCLRFVDAMLAQSDRIVEELSWQIGRPISQGPGELRGLEERARYMIEIAERALAPIKPEPKSGFMRWIDRAPLGVVLNLPAWNFPYLTAVNAFIPALMAGNGVVLKHSSQTALCAERIADAFLEADLPEGLFEVLRLDHATTEALIQSSSVDYVCFTGSVNGGRAVQRAARERFIGLGLELGGKDPAYVRADAPLENAIETLVDGAMFNSGQSCCGIERIYVDEALYDDFIEGFVTLTAQYRLGTPLDPQTNLGPMVRTSAAKAVREQIFQAQRAGATAHIDPEQFIADHPNTAYLAPQVLTDVTHEMSVMREESFGPVVGIMKVRGDEEAVALMNDSSYGLTASLWTEDVEAAQAIAPQIETGTVFMNRCDYLDPALAWTGVKDTGRGCTLSSLGYEQLTRPQSFHFKL